VGRNEDARSWLLHTQILDRGSAGGTAGRFVWVEPTRNRHIRPLRRTRSARLLAPQQARHLFRLTGDRATHLRGVDARGAAALCGASRRAPLGSPHPSSANARLKEAAQPKRLRKGGGPRFETTKRHTAAAGPESYFQSSLIGGASVEFCGTIGGRVSWTPRDATARSSLRWRRARRSFLNLSTSLRSD
jgi:hypothetical protein